MSIKQNGVQNSDCHCGQSQEPQLERHFSRRHTLKILGALALAPAISISLADNTAHAQGSVPTGGADNSAQVDIAKEYEFIYSSPISSFVLEQLKSAGFSAEKVTAEKLAELDVYHGMRLANIIGSA